MYCMTYSAYSNHFMKLVYYLTTKQKMMTPNEVQRHVEDKFEGVSSRTILRWYRFLKEQEENDYSFDYYPYIDFNALGLSAFLVIFDSNKNEEILRLIPHCCYGFIGRNNNFEKRLMGTYLIPPKNLSDFQEVLEEMKKQKLINNYYFLEQGGRFNIYNEFHKIFDEEGNLDFNKKLNNDYFVNRIEIKRKNIEIIDEIKKEPFIIPVIFEKFRESWSSPRLWAEMEKNLGDKIWDYISNIKIHGNKNPDKAIKYIQTLQKKMQKNFDRFFEQTVIYYKPFFSTRENTSVYLKMKLKDNSLNTLKKMSSELSKCVVETIIYPSKNFDKNQEVLVFAVSSFSQLFKLIKSAKKYDSKMEYLLADPDEIWKVWKREYMKFDYWKLFDVKNKKWIFNKEEYIKKIKNYKEP